MAASLGSLVVSLGLNAAEFTTGLTKAEFEAKKFSDRLDRGIAAGARAAGVALTLMAGAAVGAFVAVDQLAKQAGHFKDLEEKTGANAEALASFSVAAKVAGTDMDAIAAASVKLTKNLTGVDDESKAAGAALTALGIPIKDFKTLDPAAQFEAVAKALAGFRDGAGKTAVAIALFGKAGADVLPFLKELEQQGGRQIILTQAQIEAADAYSDAQARARAQLNAYAQVAATQALPAITAFTTALSEAVKTVVGMDEASKGLAANNAVETFAVAAAKTLGILVEGVLSTADAFRVLGITIGAIGAEIASGSFATAKAIKAEAEADIARIQNRRSFVAVLDEQIDRQRKIAIGLALISDKNNDARDFQAQKQTLTFAGAAPKGGGGAGADRISEAQRFLESLQKQVDRTLELTTLETVLKEIQSGRLKGLTPAIESQIIATAKQIDAYHDLQDAIKAINKAFDDEVRAQQVADRERDQAVKSAFAEAESIKDANRQLEDEIKIIIGGEPARKKIERDRVQAAIDIKEQALAEALLNDSMKGQADALALQIRFLKERQEKLGRRDLTEQLALDAKNFQDFKNIFADSASNALTDFITGTKTAKEAFIDFAKSVNAQIVKIASQNLANELFGGTNGQGFDFGKILSQLTGGALGGKGDSVGGFFSKLFGGGTSAAGAGAEATTALALTGSATALTASGGALTASSAAIDVSAAANTAAAGALTGAAAALTGAAGALAASSAASAASGLSGLFGSALSGMAQGGGLAGGTDFARGGLTLVGENGPELVIMPRGAQVKPNNELVRGVQGNVVHMTINVPRGTSGPSADQIAIQTGAAVQRALARNA